MSEKKISLSRSTFQQRNRRSFLGFGVAALSGVLGLRWLLTANPDNEAIPDPLRAGLEANGNFWRHFYSPDRQNSATGAPPTGTKARINGDIGLEKDMDLHLWRLEYESPTIKKTFTLEELAQLPRTSSQSEFRCIEGWSMPIGYAGIRFSDFLTAVDPDATKMPYVGLETPDAAYYVSLDMESMLHPQTVLADQMNGAPLGKEHGEPLRLIVPVKYGIKNLKRVGRIFVAAERPPDYWADDGYDWYSGH